MAEAKQAVPFLTQVRTMGGNFWVANLIESCERLAFFGVRAVLPLYMVGAAGAGGLGLSYGQKGVIYMVWALLQCLVPMVSGGYAEAYGYKRSLYVAFVLNITGYTLMANAHGFWSMMLAGVCVGTGTAIFKPPVQGSVARALGEGNSSLGFGIFYWVVNIGGMIAPMAAAWARGNEAHPTWPRVFYGAALVTLCNFLPAIFLFREPAHPGPVETASREAGAGAYRSAPVAGPVRTSPWRVFTGTLRTLWSDQPMLRFLLIISGFWFMFMQLWDLLPNFLDEWVDARDVGHVLTTVLGARAQSFLTATGAAKPEMLINIDSLSIVLLVIPLSWAFGRFKMMTALVTGMAVALVGFLGSGLTQAGWVAGLAIFVFAIGEILCSPKFSEYIGMAAPPDKKALYMGYSNIPFAIGWAAGNGLSGPLYDTFASRNALARRYLVDVLHVPRDVVRGIRPEQLLDAIATRLGHGATAHEATRALWDAYHPWVIWVLLGTVGLVSLLGMLWSYRRAPKRDGVTPGGTGGEAAA